MADPAYDDLVRRLRAGGCVFAEEEARLVLDSVDGSQIARLVGRRIAGEPLEHLLGWVDFCGVRVAVAPGVFIPRQRTAYLVDLASAAVPDRGVVVDLCCGSGALGLVVALRRPGIVLHAADLDPAAVACARDNLAAVGGIVHVGDLDAPLPTDLLARVDVLLANVPYVPTDAVALMPAEAREHEPRATFDGGPDGLGMVRRLAAAAPKWLRPGGSAYVEVGADQASAAGRAFADAGLEVAVHHDEERDATVVTGVAGVR